MLPHTVLTLILVFLVCISGCTAQIQVSSNPVAIELPYSVSILPLLVIFFATRSANNNSAALFCCWRIALLRTAFSKFWRMILTTPTQPGTLSLQHRVVKLLFLLCTYSLYCHSFGMHFEELDDPCRHGCWILYYTMGDIKSNEILTQKSHRSTVEALVPSHIMNASAFLTCKFQVLGDFLLFRAVSSGKCVSTTHNTSKRRILNSSSWPTRVQQPYTP